MDFIDELQQLASKIPALCPILKTEEATKNALVMPFIKALGYDIFDPTEVIPEYIADVGIKKGEKVDYAIAKDDKIIMLWECKHCGGDLSLNHASQLFRYFAVTDARIAVLTNGVVYRFFTDLEAPNKMDDKPFLEINMLELNEALVAEVKKLTKPAFNLDELLTSAGELKYTREIKRMLGEQLENPTDEFVRMFATQLHSGSLTPKVREKFTDITRRGFHGFINDRINLRLKSAIDGGGSVAVQAPVATMEKPLPVETAAETPAANTPVTTEEEMEGYYIVKALLRDVVDPARIVHRDTQSYFGILLDNNNRKPLARLHFNNKGQKYIGIFDESRNEERVAIATLNDIYQHADKLRRVFAFYEQEQAPSELDNLKQGVQSTEVD